MIKNKDEDFQENMPIYTSKCSLVRDLYWKRIGTAIKFADLKNENVILDIGCNTGYLLRKIRNVNTKCECWGIDIEPKIITLNIENCQFRVADVTKMPFKDNFFDIIFALSILEHIKDLKSAIKEISRVLKPNGFVVISSPTESSFYRFCRFLLFGVFEKNVKRNEPGFRGEIDFHFQNAYEIEKKFQESGFTKILQKSLPGFPVPELHRIVKFQK